VIVVVSDNPHVACWYVLSKTESVLRRLDLLYDSNAVIYEANIVVVVDNDNDSRLLLALWLPWNEKIREGQRKLIEWW
jgi:hypothetical protein